MKYTDLTKEQQKHFNSVVDYYGCDFPEDATHVDFDGDPEADFLLLKEENNTPFFWDELEGHWVEDKFPAKNFYQIPDKPWYHPEDIRFAKVDEETTKFIQKAVESGNIEFEMSVVKKPKHYQLLPEYEVKDVMKALLDKIEDSDFKMSYYEAGWFQQSMQYFLRFYAKNGVEDLEKGLETMQFVVDSIKKRGGK